MKIAPLIAIIATLGLGVAGWMYSSQQQTTMKLVIGATAGPDGASGMKAVNQTLDGRVASVSGERKKALEASAEAHTLMQRSAEELSEAEGELARQEAARDEMAAKVKEAKEHQAALQEENEALLAFFRGLPVEGMSGVSDLEEAAARFEEVVKAEKERTTTLSTTLDELKTVLDAAVKKVESERAELARLDGANRRFEEEYRKNGDEFTILNVNERYRFVVFNVGKDSGLVASDSHPLLVKRNGEMLAKLRVRSIDGGQVVAEFDADELPKGVRLMAGDRVFRQKPIGS